ncbi:hypothetical protein [Loktanella sp. SALINAS62]|uniref:hypothetical protein n=1 Tax=Loktanella sp. SALINAS62 TaxID=2706124 RepID=UPI001B8C9856|nr:hypothetical protein [Loktanella sp. SALINAS62]MBS1301536.1 hypothetical protein [Loktanella sp. SALINAS62]
MSREYVAYVRIPGSLSVPISQLVQGAEASLVRNTKLPPGDRTEAVRFENLHATIDQIAIAVMLDSEASCITSNDSEVVAKTAEKAGVAVLHKEDAVDESLPSEVRSWISTGSFAVELLLPHGQGRDDVIAAKAASPIPLAKRWKSSARGVRAAVKERFEDTIISALQDVDLKASISPSGVSNRVLTDTLHKYCQFQTTHTRRDVPVVYRDGSCGPDFPLGALTMCEPSWRNVRTLRFTLLSIRHVEMDSLVDGAWLRNTRISRTREAGLTDRIVFEQSRKQIRSLDLKTPTLIEMYQTGLETAIIGFYRAVALHLIEHPGTLAVKPMFFIGGNRFEPSERIWAA